MVTYRNLALIAVVLNVAEAATAAPVAGSDLAFAEARDYSGSIELEACGKKTNRVETAINGVSAGANAVGSVSSN
ncbi:unnamed protein product [Clonostachys chloroleuca]|uniref:Uncharacterized protein n=1 Tax=Clonostachys chloroleuca TaxID=1926264 RepID=A0AA35M717_9HYPO|nr:unnamed protein product [Clonostachys chloroleuca]